MLNFLKDLNEERRYQKLVNTRAAEIIVSRTLEGFTLAYHFIILTWALEDLHYEVWFNSIVLCPTDFRLFITGSYNAVIYKWLRKIFKLYSIQIIKQIWSFWFQWENPIKRRFWRSMEWSNLSNTKCKSIVGCTRNGLLWMWIRHNSAFSKQKDMGLHKLG